MGRAEMMGKEKGAAFGVLEDVNEGTDGVGN